MTSMHAPRAANNVDAYVGARIRERRQTLKISQEVLGNLLGVTFQQIQKYERGTNRVGAGRLWKLAKVLKVPVGFFYDGLEARGFDTELSVAETEQPPLYYEFQKTPDGIALMDAVSRISNDAVRKRILELARSLADEDPGST